MLYKYSDEELKRLYDYLGLTIEEQVLVEEIDTTKEQLRDYWVNIGKTDMEKCLQIVNNINLEYLTGTITTDKSIDNSNEYMYIRRLYQLLHTLIGSIQSTPYEFYIDTVIMCNILRKIAPEYVATIIGDFNVSFNDEDDICFQNWLYRN